MLHSSSLAFINTGSGGSDWPLEKRHRRDRTVGAFISTRGGSATAVYLLPIQSGFRYLVSYKRYLLIPSPYANLSKSS
jgi:hypothetical protein